MNPVNFIVKKYKNEPDEVWDSNPYRIIAESSNKLFNHGRGWDLNSSLAFTGLH